MTTSISRLSGKYVDAAFPLRGETIPLDHGYVLYSALSRRIPTLHRRSHWAVHPVLGRMASKGTLRLFARSRLLIRLPADEIGEILPLAERSLDIDGHICSLGFPRLFPLRSTPSLQSRLVVIKGATESPNRFCAALRRQVARIPDLGQDPEQIEYQIGPRRILRIKGITIAGHAAALTGLGAQGSIAIQSRGLGGRRHMGAGVFIPPRRSA